MHCYVAGGNTGIGFETAKALAISGYQDIILACRSSERGDAATKALSAVTPAGSTFKNELLCLDDLSSVKDFVKRMQVRLAPSVLAHGGGCSS
jgi:NAD(P)-dependent dehydrogenase (short-subunit alcohol dehydrogenase family)